MYIEPNTNIKILHNVPLDNTYTNTIYFASASAQSSYFSSLTKYNLTGQSYQRKERGYMRVQINAENLYNCNYLMYQNTSFGNKWFYCFITSVEYVNNEVSEIGFELDVMQTWFFDVTLKQCFVEREHSKTDVAGDNIIPEPIKFGEYFDDNPVNTGLFDDYGFVLVAPYHYIGSQATPYHDVSYITKNPSAVTHYYYNALANVQADLFALEDGGYSDNVLCLYMIPKDFITWTGESVRQELPEDVVTKSFAFTSSKPTTLGTYTPVNKKLLTFPYNKFTIETFDGNSTDYAYEFFSTNEIRFLIYGCLTSNVSFKAIPVGYKGTSQNYLEGVVLTDFPMVAFTTDAYRAWFAQNKTRLGVQGVASLLGAKSDITEGLAKVTVGSKMLTPVRKQLSAKGARTMQAGYQQVGDALVDNMSTIASGLSEGIGAKTLGTIAQGSTDGSLEIAMGKKDFNYIHQYVNPKEAKIIDDFFTMYGYATKEIKVPNRNVRPHWTYTKTVGCNLIGNAPADDVRKICSIYDNGITFWVNGSEVGNYSLNNSPK